MNRKAREKLIAQCQADIDAGVADIEMRKVLRLERQLAGLEPVDEFVMPPKVVNKSVDDNGFNIQDAIEDQLWRQRNYRPPASNSTPASNLDTRVVNVSYLREWTGCLTNMLVDETAGFVAEVTRPLIKRIEALEVEIGILRGRGNVTDIKDKRDAKTA
jgi:hypothetical protein